MIGRLKHTEGIWSIEIPAYEDEFGMPVMGSEYPLHPYSVRLLSMRSDKMLEHMINDEFHVEILYYENLGRWVKLKSDKF